MKSSLAKLSQSIILAAGMVAIAQPAWAGCQKPKVSEYEDIGDCLYEGLARVKKDGKYGFINKAGKVVAPPQYDDANPFYESLAAVEKDGKYGFINKAGKIVIPPQYDYAYEFSEGLAAVKKDGKYGFINKAGKVVIPLQYDNAYKFREGLAAVHKDDKQGFINKAGKVVIPLQYDMVDDFKEGLVNVYKDGKWGLINKAGKVLASPQFGFIYDFNNGRARVYWPNGDEGYINKQGKIISRRSGSGNSSSSSASRSSSSRGEKMISIYIDAGIDEMQTLTLSAPTRIFLEKGTSARNYFSYFANASTGTAAATYHYSTTIKVTRMMQPDRWVTCTGSFTLDARKKIYEIEIHPDYDCNARIRYSFS